MFLTPMR